MRRLFYGALFMIAALFTACSEDNTVNSDPQLVIKKIVFVKETYNPPSGDRMYFNKSGHPTVFTNLDSTEVNRNHLYDNQGRLDKIERSGMGASEFYYSGNTLTEAEHNFGFNPYTTFYTENGNTIEALLVSQSSNTFKVIYRFMTSERIRLTRIEFINDPDSNTTPSTIYTFEYDDNFNVTKQTKMSYDDTLDDYVTTETIEATYDDQNSIYKNIYSLGMPAELNIVPTIDYNAAVDYIDRLARFSPNNILTRTTTYTTSGTTFTYAFDYTYNDLGFPIYASRTLSGASLTTYSFEYHVN